MTEYTVGRGGDFVTLSAAAKAAKAGDVVHIRAGVYRELLTLDTPRVTWVGEPGAVIDGGWNRKTKTESWANQVTFRAAGVTVRGLMIRNCPGRGVAVLADDPTLEDCIIENTYRGAILVGDSNGQPIKNVVIRRNIFRNMSLSWVVGDRGINGRSVNGSFNIQNIRDSVIEGNVLYNSYGEGINISRGSYGVIVRGNTVYSMAHVLVYVNRAQRTTIEGNRLYHIPNPVYGGPKGDSMSAAIVIGDEGGPITSKHPASEGTIIRGNVVVNTGALLQARNNKHNYDTQLADTIIEDNTFIAGPSTRQGIIIQTNQRGRSHKNSIFRNNVIEFSRAAKGADIGSFGQGSGVEFSSNAWTAQPPQSMRSASDVTGDLMLVNPAAALGNGIDVDNYRPLPSSRLVRGDAVIGALSVSGQEPPVEEPPSDPEPVDWITISLADFEQIRANVRAVHAMLENMAADTGEE